MTFNYRPLLERLSAPICRRVIHVRGARLGLLSEDPTRILPPHTWEVTPTPKLISLGVLTAVTAPKTDGFGRMKRISARRVDLQSWASSPARLFGRHRSITGICSRCALGCAGQTHDRIE